MDRILEEDTKRLQSKEVSSAFGEDQHTDWVLLACILGVEDFLGWSLGPFTQPPRVETLHLPASPPGGRILSQLIVWRASTTTRLGLSSQNLGMNYSPVRQWQLQVNTDAPPPPHRGATSHPCPHSGLLYSPALVNGVCRQSGAFHVASQPAPFFLHLPGQAYFSAGGGGAVVCVCLFS